MRRFLSFATMLLNCALLLHLFIPAAAQTVPAGAATLHAQPVEREIAGGDAHTYDLTLTAGQFLKLEIQFKGTAGSIVVYGPDDRQLIGPRSDSVPMHVALIAATDGRHRIEVRSPKTADGNAAAGRYRLWIAEPRAATEADRHYAAAQALSDEARNLLEKKTAASRREAAAKFQQALPAWRAAGDQHREAETLHAIASIWNLLGDNSQALAAGQSYLALTRASGDRQQEATALSELGTVFNRMGDRRKGADYHRQAMLLSRELGNRNQELISLNNLGVSHSSLGELQQALAYYQQALPLARELGNRGMEARILNNIGIQYSSLGDASRALEYCQNALALRRTLGLREEQASSLHNLSLIWFRMGEYQQALDADKEALAISESSGNRQFQIVASTLLGQIHLRLGEHAQAEEYFNRALALSRAAGYKEEEASLLTNVGNLHLVRNEIPQAMKAYDQAMALHRALGARLSLATDLNQIGLAHLSQNNVRQAIESFEQALALSRELGYPRVEATVLERLGRAHRLLGEWEKATDYLQRALVQARAVDAVYTEKETRYNLAQLALDRGDYAQAQAQAEEAIRLIEKARTNVGSQELRATYRARAQKIYEILLETLVRQHERNPAGGFVERAFEVSELSRARSLVEMLDEARVDLRQGIAPELLARERDLQRQLAAKSDQLIRMRASELRKEQTTALKEEIARLLAEYADAQTRIRLASPRYAALTGPEPLRLREIQQQALDARTLLLEYSLGEQRSHLFAVTATTLRGFTLPGRREIEAQARLYYRLVTERGAPGVFRSAEESRQWAARKDREIGAAAATLSRTLLGPAANLLGRKRLLIVADGILHYVPFAALPEPRAGRPEEIRPEQRKDLSAPLILGHEIVTLPSVSALLQLRRETLGRAPARKTIAVLADPIFEETDDRMKNRAVAQTRTAPPKTAETPSALREVVMEAALDTTSRLVRLPLTRWEAEGILALAPASERKIALDFEASRALAMSPALGEYRYLHFATHSLLNNTHPQLSGLAFSLFDKRGEPQDGFLRTMDVYNLRLSADLVVLSGCRTALGKEISGEGLVGLTRGFMYAGAKRVMAGLWAVNDAATAELMRRFYRELLGPKRRSPSAALRAAQVSLWRESRWQSPFYWAAFTLQGEW